MSGLFGSITIKGNRLTDFAAQTSTVGIPIPFGFGKFPCEGNVIFAPMPPKEHVTKKKQGKGGVKTQEYSYTLSYAIAFCEGPIYGYLTIKRGGKVVWTQDPNATLDDLAYAAKWAQKATFYYGTETQLPDSTIEAYKGAGKVSAHRGLAYIVVEDDDVTDNGGAVPPYEAVIIASPPDVYLTSRPYSLATQENITTVPSLRVGVLVQFPIESFNVAPQLLEGSLEPVLVTLALLPESFNVAPQLLEGSLEPVLVTLALLPESFNVAPQLLEGSLFKTLIHYTDYPAESFNLHPTLLEGSLL